LAPLLLTAMVAVAIGLVPREAQAKRQLKLGLADPVFSSNASTRALWLDRARGAGARTIGLAATWRRIATAQPADPTNPADPAYNWSGLDAVVRDATARSLRVFVTIIRAPVWAEGPNRDPDAEPGTWRPDPGKLAQFSTAAATRYSGNFPDPRFPGQALPAVRDWEVWAEPNLWVHLGPQFKPGGKSVAADHYRKLLNAGYKAIKGVSGSNRVVAGGTAPFGDYAPGQISPGKLLRTPPLEFWRDLLCLRGKKLKKKKRCKGPAAHLDVVAHNPLSWFSDSKPGASPHKKGSRLGGPDDIVVPDMKKLKKLVRKARKHKTIRPRKRTKLWATELLWESNPPDPQGTPLAKQAKWLADAMRLLRRQGVSRVYWIRIVDAVNLDALQSGLYFADGTPKPALQA
jgi:hypothetical protein